MNKVLIFILVAVAFIADSYSNVDLDAAYKREYIFLTSQIKELKKQKHLLEKRYEKSLKKAGRDLENEQNNLIKISNENQKLSDKLFKIEQNHESWEQNKSTFENMKKQAALFLNLKNNDDIAISDIFKKAISRINTSSSIRIEGGKFYLENGENVSGKILRIGNIASIGKYKNDYFSLAPAGKLELRVWKKNVDGSSLFNLNMPKISEFFIYEGLSKEIKKKEEQSIIQFVNSGGTIAWVIVMMGIIAISLCVIRFINLKLYYKETKKLEKVCDDNNENLSNALISLKGLKSDQKNLISKIVELKEESKEKIEDVIEEGIINEHKFIDRFGALILVFAAVAPLMGLLGTVTGMISTFDIITEHGTGDPKLLSHGISEALITTELGLIVAIPSLLLGNVLAGKGKNIKMMLDKLILKVVNN